MKSPALVLDSHIDIPWPDGEDPFGQTGRCVDIPKMRVGGMNAGCFVAYVPQTARTADLNRQAAERATAMLERIGSMRSDAEHGLVAPASSHDLILDTVGNSGIAIIPAVENGHALGGMLEHIGTFARLGARYLTLTHNGHNDLADSAIPRRDLDDPSELHEGLSGLGREAIAELNAHAMLVDVSHAAKTSMMQAVKLSRTPIVATHSCIRALCDHPRNLDDEQLDALADTGGVIQVTAMPWFLKRGGTPAEVGVAQMVEHIAYAVQRIGIEHVGISSDFDGGGGITGWMNAAETAHVTQALIAAGFAEAEIGALWGGNFMRLLRLAEQHAASSEKR